MTITEIKHIPKRVLNRNQKHKALQKHPVFPTNYDHAFSPDEIKRLDTIEYDRNMSVDETYE